ncbi:MAG: cytochrome-c peroxidase [Sandaracinaceae bacterium]|nr:cytochrome-c peroxidase [Sandaracinaceae bacterium]
MRLLTTLCVALALATGCAQTDSNVPDDGPPPISGGTLHVTRDGQWAIASDPARAAIHIVDLNARTETARIDLGPTEEPGRVGEDLDGGVHVVLRRGGAIASIDPVRGRVIRRTPVCAAPRGIDVDPANGNLVVACAEGQLVRLTPAGEIVRRVTLEHDLRDVVAQDGRLYVSRFRNAEVLVVEGDAIVGRVRPSSVESGFGAERAPTVAWRMRRSESGGVLMVHQEAVSSQLGDLSFPGAPYYGGDCLTGVVRSAVTRITPDLGTTTLALETTSLAVDVVEQGGSTYVAAASEPGVALDDWGFIQRNGVRRILSSSSFSAGCRDTDDGFASSGPRPRSATAVERTPSGQLIAQYRDPAELVIDGETISLNGGSVLDFGHALFHEGAGTGVACASCHPEGGDDGHVWMFDIGQRKTQTTAGGILATAPFHWEGNVPDVSHVLDGTFVGRMQGTMPRPDEVDAFSSWMNSIPAVPGPTIEADVAARGRAAFEGAGCVSCHAGELRTNNESANVGTGGTFQVPALYEVLYHAPYLHDGSAETLEDAVAGHGGGEALSTTQRADVVAYLRSL